MKGEKQQETHRFSSNSFHDDCTCTSGIKANVPDVGNGIAESVLGGKAIVLTFKAPADSETYIAPGRHFKVSGTIEGDVPDDAVLRVSLIDADGISMKIAGSIRASFLFFAYAQGL